VGNLSLKGCVGDSRQRIRGTTANCIANRLGQWFQVKRMKLKIGSLSVILNKLKGLVNFCIFAKIF
jgi:hypothetical protein